MAIGRQVELTHNPYRVTTELWIDGKKEDENSRLMSQCKCQERRLQFWIEKFLDDLPKMLRTGKVSLTFRGTDVDADDVENAINQYNGEHKGCVYEFQKVISTKKSDEERINQLKDLFEKAKAKEGVLRDFFPDDQVKKMQRAFQEALDPTFGVYVIAPVSSGKSTVLNALLGKKLMPAQNKACTATITRIKDHDGMKEFQAKRFDKEGKLILECKSVTLETMKDWNNGETSLIEIEGDIKTIEQGKGCTIVFIDTPGPNNALNTMHETMTWGAIRKKRPITMILYVMAINTGMATTDSAGLLGQIQDEMGKGDRMAQDRFIFLANKIDDVSSDEDSVEELLGEARRHVACYKNRKPITNPMIIPVSAKLAQNLRIKKYGGKLSEDAEDELSCLVKKFVRNEKKMDMLEQAKPCLSPTMYQKLRRRLEQAKTDEEKAELLSGIPIVEELLNEFLRRHAIPMKLKDAYDALEIFFKDWDIARKMETVLSKSKKEIEKIRDELEKLQTNKKSIEEGGGYRDDIQNMTYKDTSETKENLKKITGELAEGLRQEIGKLKNKKADKQSADSLIEIVKGNCRRFDNELRHILDNTLKDQGFSEMAQLRDKYQKYVETVLKEIFPDGGDIKELQLAAMSMPSSDKLMQDAMWSETVRGAPTGSHKECAYEFTLSGFWKVWKLLDWHTVTDYEEEERHYVDLKKIGANLILNVNLHIGEAIDHFHEIAKSNFEVTKEKIRETLSKIDERVRDVQEEIEKAMKDEKVKVKMQEEIKRKNKRFEDFNRQLEEILEV